MIEAESRSPFSPKANLYYSGDDIGHLTNALERSLDFGKFEVARTVEGRDVAKLRRWVGGLGWLEGERRSV